MTTIATTLATLPLQVRVGLRDKFDASAAPIRTALQSLTSLVGYELSPEIAWVDLWNSLSPHYSEDKTVFVPTITEAVRVFYKRLDDLLQADEAFQDTFLEKMQSARKALYVQIHEQPNPKTAFVRGELLTLYLPNAGASDYRSIGSRIGSDIEQAFNGNANDDFVEIPADVPVSSTNASASNAAPAQERVNKSRVTSLPSVSSLPRPEVLFPSLLPYTLVVRRNGGGFDIESSHQPTLELIAEYFKKHSRKNLNDTRQIPYFKVELVASYWGAGTLHDVVRITKEDQRQSWVIGEMSPILAFVESVCGYELFRVDGGEWIYRRHEPFV